MHSGAEQDDAAGSSSAAASSRPAQHPSVSSSAVAGFTEYGSTKLTAAEHVDGHKGAGEDKRSCGSYFAGRDWPVLLLPWLLFAMVHVTFGIGSEMLLSVLALLYALYISGVLAYLSIGRGGPWMFFSMLCGLSAVMGLVFGLLFRTEAALNEPDGRRSLGYCIVILLIYLLVVLAVSRALQPLGVSLIGSSAAFAEKQGWGWNPVSAASIRFGCDCRNLADVLMESHEFPEQVSADLMKHRAYWSGEPAYDYVFHVANEHTFIGVLFAHPANPYEKYERFLVLVLVAILIVFPVAAFTAAVHNKVLRVIVVLILVTAPRNLLRLYLKRIVIADDEIIHRDLQEQRQLHHSQAQPSQAPPEVMPDTGKDLEQRRGTKHWQGALKQLVGRQRSTTWQQAVSRVRAANAFWWEVVFFTVGIFTASLIILLTCLFVKAHAMRPLGVVLLESTNGLGWAFILELIFDQLIAHRSSDKHRGVEEKWFFGFFHRWRQERDEYIKKPTD